MGLTQGSFLSLLSWLEKLIPSLAEVTEELCKYTDIMRSQ